jgi:ribonuclease P protein component
MAGCAGRLGSREVEHVFASGWTISSRNLVLKGLQRPGAEPCRLAVVAGKRLGAAPIRNRARRRVREALRTAVGSMPAGLDLVVIVRPAVIDMAVVDLAAEVEQALVVATRRVTTAR